MDCRIQILPDWFVRYLSPRASCDSLSYFALASYCGVPCICIHSEYTLGHRAAISKTSLFFSDLEVACISEPHNCELQQSQLQLCCTFQEAAGPGPDWFWGASQIPRGDLQTTFLFKGFDEARRLGLNRDTEAHVRAALTANATLPSAPGNCYDVH